MSVVGEVLAVDGEVDSLEDGFDVAVTRDGSCWLHAS